MVTKSHSGTHFDDRFTARSGRDDRITGDVLHISPLTNRLKSVPPGALDEKTPTWDMWDLKRQRFSTLESDQHFALENHYWLVVEPYPSEKSVGMMTFPIYGKIKNVPNHQSDYL